MPKSILSLLAVLLVPVVVAGVHQSGIADPVARDICAAVAGVDLPPGDRPSTEERAALAGCVSADLYFGFGAPPDPVRARKCAYIEMDAGDKEPVFGGRTVLMMVYANGKGAERNFDLALKLACAIGGAPQDIAGRVHALARLKAGNWTGDRFSICDHSTGKLLYEQCAVLQDRFDKIDRERTLEAITRTWRDADQKAFQPFRQAADRYFQAHASKEADLESTIEVHERAFLERGLIAAIQQFEQGNLPRFSAGDLRQAEAAMNAAYASTQRGNTHQWGTATSDGIRQTQQTWIAYRDAWTGFAHQKYPGVSSESWRTWLARDRTGLLAKFPQSNPMPPSF